MTIEMFRKKEIFRVKNKSFGQKSPFWSKIENPGSERGNLVLLIFGYG